MEDGVKISELNTTTTYESEDLIPIVQSEETKSISVEDLLSSNDIKGDTYEYTLSRVTSTLGTLTWYDMATNETTATIPKGRYLFLYRGEVQGSSSTTNVCTIQPMIDGSGSNSQRFSVPTNSYGSAFQVWRIVNFSTDATHTLNVQGWSNSQFSPSRDIVVTIIRLK